MKVYFVRHGESQLNAQRVHQLSTTELSEIGKQQAEVVAKRLLKLPIDVLLSSTYSRAKQTADIIRKFINKPIEYSPLFNERKRPTVIEGRATNEPEVVAINNKITQNLHNPTWRHSDEETFFDMKERAENALTYLTEYNKEHIAVVTHGDFLRMLIGVMGWGNAFKAEDYILFLTFLPWQNTAITVCEYKEEKWKLVTWNDETHLVS